MAKRSRARASGSEFASPEELDAIFGALSHAARRQVLVVLHARGGGMTAGQIADRFRHSWPTTTRHLGVLESAGLVRVEVSGRERIYFLVPEGVRRAAAWCGWSFERPPELLTDESWKGLSYAFMQNAAGSGTGRAKGGKTKR